MNGKKRFTVIVIMLALLFIGIGYAAVSQKLNINGTAQTVDDNELSKNLNVYFSSYVDKSTSPLSAEVPTTLGSGVRTISLNTEGFAKAGDTAIVAIEITNGSTEYKVDITAAIEHDARFNVTYDFRTSSAAANGTSTASGITVGSKTYLFVTVELIKAPVTQITDATFTITLTATAVE